MSTNSGTPLYLEVEAALKDFKTGVSSLREQQAKTETLLAQGGEALDTLVQQMARVDSLKEDVESDLRLLEKYKGSLDKKVTAAQQQFLEELEEYQQTTRKSMDNVKTDLSLRRKELLGLIQEAQDNLKALENLSQQREQNFQRQLHHHRRDLDTALEKVKAKLRAGEELNGLLSNRLGQMEKRFKYLVLAVAAMGLLTLVALIW